MRLSLGLGMLPQKWQRWFFRPCIEFGRRQRSDHQRAILSKCYCCVAVPHQLRDDVFAF